MQATITPDNEVQNTRRLNRLPISLPVKIEGQDTQEISWQEITRLRDVSSYGAAFSLSRPVKRGRLIKMTLPMPRQMRCYDFFESQYHVWGVVRRCILLEESAKEDYFLGVAFIGKVPPKTYTEDPSLIYDVSHRSEEEHGLWQLRQVEKQSDESHLPREDRRHSRFDIPMNLTVEKIDRSGNTLESEPTVSENISLGGASIYTSLTVEVGSLLKVTSSQHDIKIKAIVRGRRIGHDGIPRLHIEFIDHFFPLSGIDT